MLAVHGAGRFGALAEDGAAADANEADEEAGDGNIKGEVGSKCCECLQTCIGECSFEMPAHYKEPGLLIPRAFERLLARCTFRVICHTLLLVTDVNFVRHLDLSQRMTGHGTPQNLPEASASVRFCFC